MPTHVYGFDDDEVYTSDGLVSVDSDIDGVEKVQGSRSFVRDPRLTSPEYARRGSSRPEKVRIASTEKWCFVCGHTRPKHYFSPKKDAFDGLDPRCKACENERKRKGYQVSVNRDVRAYHRKVKAAV